MCLFDSELPLFLGGAGNYLEYMVWHLGGCYFEMKTLLEYIGEYDAVPRPFFFFSGFRL
jgi:hypothetical protein